ncbi:MAG: carbon-nitrogen hydrolase family protein [Bacteroidota bacterium]
MKNNNKSRRDFIKKTALGTGAVATLGATSKVQPSEKEVSKSEKLPRKVWIATVSQQNVKAKNPEEMISKILKIMEEIVPMNPDIICLPEVFPYAYLPKRPPLSESAEKPIGPVTDPFAQFAKKHNCYVICATYTEDEGKYYNSAVLIDRKGEPVGEYRKMFPTAPEMERGIKPGPIEPPVFDTDFGRIGMQICYDNEWIAGWDKLQKAGAEIVFWASAFSGGEKLNSFARLFNYYVVSSTRKGPARVIDITGDDIATTGIWQQNWVCASINMEKAVVSSWPHFTHFNDIIKKYGQDVRITNLHNEEVSIIESLSAEIKVSEILEEFKFKGKKEELQEVEKVQERNRK